MTRKFAAVVVTMLAVTSCQDTAAPFEATEPHMIVRFGFPEYAGSDRDFVARATRASLLDSIRAQMAVAPGLRSHLIGPIHRALEGENLGWNWSFDYNEWSLAEVTMELCDGSPKYVHDNLDHWLASVGSYCPWGAVVIDTAWVMPSAP